MGRRALARTLIVVAPAAVALAVATAAPAASGTAKVDVGFSIDRFVKRGSGLVANGRAVATYVGADGTTKSTTQRFTATAVVHGLRRLSSASTTCSVLYLELDKLSLTLLGLIATLNQVHLTIDADATRGVLGSCRRRAKSLFR